MRFMPRFLFLMALATSSLDVAQAALTQYYGVVRGLRFGCTPSPYQGRATLQVFTTISFLGPGFGAPRPGSNEAHTLLLTESAPIPGSGRDATLSGMWATTGVDDPRAWGSEPGAIVAGWRDNALPQLPPSNRRCGGEIYLRGTGSIVEVTRPSGEQHCSVDWIFQGQERNRPPNPPRNRNWSKDPARVWLRIQSDLAANCALTPQVDGIDSADPNDSVDSIRVTAEAAPPPTVAVTPCAGATLCFARSAQAAPELLVRSRALPGGQVIVSYLPLGVGGTEVWSLPVGQPVANARSWFLPGAPATGLDHAGFVGLAWSSSYVLHGVADRAGFDMLELHYAHGYLMSAFITPLTNRRRDDYGGSLANRMRFPLEVFHAVRVAWPETKPISVRISAHDWVGPDGITPEEGVEIARLLQQAGVDIIDVSAGQTSIDARPVYGRMFQTPFSDRIRNEVGIATMAVGNIYEADHVNSILMAGRADLCCLARPHLADPYWTLHAAAQLGYGGETWPKPYLAGRDQLHRLAVRAAPTTEPV